MNGPKAVLPDTAAALNSRAGLRDFVDTAYDYAAALLRDQPEARRQEKVKLFDHEMPRWQVRDEIHAHAVATAGQAVTDFRMLGMAPPAFTLFRAVLQPLPVRSPPRSRPRPPRWWPTRRR